MAERFAGHPLRWPRLAWVQTALLGGGVLTGAAALAFRAYGESSGATIVTAHAMIAAGFAIFALMIAGAFFGHASQVITVSAVRIEPAPGGRGRPLAS